MPPHAPSPDAEEDPRAFVAIQAGERRWVVDLAVGDNVLGSASGCAVPIDVPGVSDAHAVVTWDGKALGVRSSSEEALLFVNGKRLSGAAELKPGDEMTIGPAQLVLGVSIPIEGAHRRALTHHEFRERLYEEMARAGRGGRQVTLVMLQARAGEGGRVAQEALDSFRAGDVVGTYSHDELEILLPDTPRAIAERLVERLLASADVTGAVCGISVAPDDGDNPERILRAARSALATARAQGQTFGSVGPRTPSAAEPEVRDASTRAFLAELEALAKGAEPVLLTGELSSGKVLFARLLHQRSGRRAGPLEVVACGAEDGAFALGRPSPAERAQGGTLVLDEIGDLDLDGQRQLREALARTRDVRVVATTHRALAGLVERSAFDRGLFELLSRHVLELPPLRSRPEDIIPLAERFARDAGATDPIQMSAGALARLHSYPWPGNVLELKNAMERAVRLASGGEILAEHLPSEVLPMGSGEGRLREHVDSVERDAIIKALADSNHNQTHAAKRLGVSRRALIYKMEKYGLKAPPGGARRL